MAQFPWSSRSRPEGELTADPRELFRWKDTKDVPTQKPMMAWGGKLLPSLRVDDERLLGFEMTEFELLAIPLSLILGLGITNILSDVSDAIRDRERVPLHWLPLFWAFLIFLFQVQYFFVLWDLYEAGTVWTWPNFGPAMFNCIVLYLSAGLILPGRRNSDSESLLMDFEKHGRFGLLTLAMMLVVALFLNVYYFSELEGLYGLAHWLPASNILNLGLLTLICLVLLVRNIKLQTICTVLFAMLQLYGMLKVWSLPGTN